MPTKTKPAQRPARLVTDERFDFEPPTPVRKSYIIASSYRCGSSFLAWQLWNTGVLGAPCEYLNPNFEMRTMMKRLKETAPAVYFPKVLSLRTSRNGVFGMKAHFHHLEAFLKGYPSLFEELAPLTYIHIHRGDKLAQAVSMAKAYQTNAWTSAMAGNVSSLQYDRELIAKCLDEIEIQNNKWLQWFDTNGVSPVEVKYEDLTADTPGVVRRIVKLLDVQDDERQKIQLPALEKQGDQTNKDWMTRYERDSKGEDKRKAAPARSPSKEVHFFDRHDRYLQNLPSGGTSASGFDNSIRMRRRYDAVIGKSRALFDHARVLDMMSTDGVWSMASLDAGAAHVVAIDPQPKRVAKAKATFDEYGISPKSYQLLTSDVLGALGQFQPQTFDLILCTNFFELHDPRVLFRHLQRLQPKYILVDTGMTPGKGPIVRYSLRMKDASAPMSSGQYATILSTPNHELVVFMCEYFGFSWRLIDWHAMGITNWTGIHDYEHDLRRTYVLERMTGSKQ